MDSHDFGFLRRTFEFATLSRQKGEWPFGALVVLNGKIVAESCDSCIDNVDVTSHAETLAIRLACQNLRTLDLSNATLYSSAEPCLLCSGAVHWARVSRVVFGLPQSELNRLTGARSKPTCDELLNIGKLKVEVRGGLLIEVALQPLEGFSFLSNEALRTLRKN